MISVVIPFYNRSDAVLKCVNSVVQDLPAGSEISLINDGSNEGQREEVVSCIKELGTKRQDIKMRMLDLKHTGNASHLRNVGARQSEGDILAFIDSDIVVGVNWFAETSEKLNSVPDCGCIGSLVFDPEGRLYHSGRYFSSELHRILYITKERECNTPLQQVDIVSNAFAVKKDVFWIEGGFNESIPIMGDETWVQLKMREAGYCNYVTSVVSAYHLKPTITRIRDIVSRYDSFRHIRMVQEGILIQAEFIHGLKFIVFLCTYVIRESAATIAFMTAGLLMGNVETSFKRVRDITRGFALAIARLLARKREAQ